MLKLENICVSFGNNTVLRDVSFEIANGDFIALMGHNGAGKSTLFDVIAGRIMPDSGRILIDEHDITALGEAARTLLIGRLLQNVRQGTVGSMTVIENLSLATLKGRRTMLAAGAKAFSEVEARGLLAPLQLNLENQLHCRMDSLSGGQRQMVAFLMATLVKPRFLLLDEPTAALDPESARKLLELARKYAVENKIPTLLITHDIDIAQRHGTKIWNLSRELGLES